MPIEIRELVIRAQVSGPADSSTSTPTGTAQASGVHTQELMTLVADMLRKKKER